MISEAQIFVDQVVFFYIQKIVVLVLIACLSYHSKRQLIAVFINDHHCIFFIGHAN